MQAGQLLGQVGRKLAVAEQHLAAGLQLLFELLQGVPRLEKIAGQLVRVPRALRPRIALRRCVAGDPAEYQQNAAKHNAYHQTAFEPPSAGLTNNRFVNLDTLGLSQRSDARRGSKGTRDDSQRARSVERPAGPTHSRRRGD